MSILHPLIIDGILMRGQHYWETKPRVPVTSMEVISQFFFMLQSETCPFPMHVTPGNTDLRAITVKT